MTALVIYGIPRNLQKKNTFNTIKSSKDPFESGDLNRSKTIGFDDIPSSPPGHEATSLISKMVNKRPFNADSNTIVSKDNNQQIYDLTSPDKDNEYEDLKDLVGKHSEGIKKIKPNYNMAKQDDISNNPGPKNNLPSPKPGDEDEQLRRIIEESEKTFAEEARKKERQFKEINLKSHYDNSKETIQDPDLDRALMESDNTTFTDFSKRQNIKESNRPNDLKDNNRPTTSGIRDSIDGEIQKAIELSKKSYNEEEYNRTGNQDMIIESDDKIGGKSATEKDIMTNYNDILDKCAEEEEDLSYEAEFDKSNLEKDDDDLTEPLESMMGQDDMNERLENEQNIEEETGDQVEENSGPKYTIRILNPEDSKMIDERKERSNGSNQRYWSYNRNYNYGGQEMFSLTANDLSQDYLTNERKGILFHYFEAILLYC